MEYTDQPGRFLTNQLYLGRQLHGFVHDLKSINRAQNSIINRLRQNLAHEFPEIAGYKATRRYDNPQKLPPFLAWIAGREVSKNANTLYSNK